jgi:3-methylcrotonyl-CoA carboxylase alpha subunit
LKILSRHPLRVRLGDRDHTLAELAAPAGEFALELDGVRATGYRHDAGDRVFVRAGGRTFVIPRARRAGAPRPGPGELRAEMPGTVIAIHAAPGQRVAAGDPLVTVESMKLQVVIEADRDAIVASLPVAVHAAFDRGAVLATLSEIPQETPAAP